MAIQSARKFERGQALPLLALALIALAGFAALALDGGNLWTEQRRAQAAADNAVMAAAYQAMSGIGVTATTSAREAILAPYAYANAAQNQYVNSDPHTTVVFHLPPIHGQYTGNSDYMEVVITQTVATSLAHLVYGQDPIPLTVIAVAHGLPTGPLMNGYALAAMKPDCSGPNTIGIQGKGGGNSGGTFLTDGGAFENSNCPGALKEDGNHDQLITNGPPIDVAGPSALGTVCSSPSDTGCNFYPAPNLNVPQVSQNPLAGSPAATLPPCGPARDLPTELADPVGIHPGSYTTLSGSFNMRPGIYCLTGGTLGGTVTGSGVLIYLVDTAANITLHGNDSLNLTAPTTTTTGCLGNADTSQAICAYLGIVIYKVTGANTCSASDHELEFTGNGSVTITGLIYAPYSLIRFGGNGNLTMTGQVIVGCAKYNGNGNLNIIYNPNATYSPPPSVELDQ